MLVYNRCSDFELISPVYFGHNAIWLSSPDHKVDINAATRASFAKDVVKSEFAGALLYKLQKKKHLESNMNNTKDALTSLQLLVIWGPNDWHGFSVRVLLIKHSSTITWDEDKLRKLHSMYLALLKDDHIVEGTWLLGDEAVLMTTSKWKEDNYEITISKGTRKDDSIVPLWVSSSM
jgi:hypothetical protein